MIPDGSCDVASVDAAIDRFVHQGAMPLGCDVARILSVILAKDVSDRMILKRMAAVEEAKTRLADLLRSPGIPQRTPEWYDARTTMITASDIAQALGCAKFGTQKQFFEKKCGHAEQPPFDASIPPLRWGIMFEPVACAIYAELNGDVVVHEFGLLRHPTVPFLGASPDGITEHGVMLEIKCPWRRKIGPEVPLQYFYQIQGQLAVCGLAECDYFECEFEAVSPEEVEDEGECRYGVFVERIDPDGGRSYVYPPWNGRKGASFGDMKAWCEEQGGTAPGGGTTNVVWWRLAKCGTIRVRADDAFVRDMMQRLAEVWERVQRYKTDRASYEAEVTGPKRASKNCKQQQQLDEYAFVDVEDE